MVTFEELLVYLPVVLVPHLEQIPIVVVELKQIIRHTHKDWAIRHLQVEVTSRLKLVEFYMTEGDKICLAAYFAGPPCKCSLQGTCKKSSLIR